MWSKHTAGLCPPHPSAAPRPSCPPQGHTHHLLLQCQPRPHSHRMVRGSRADHRAATPCRAPAAAGTPAPRRVKGQQAAQPFSASPTARLPCSGKQEQPPLALCRRAALLYPGPHVPLGTPPVSPAAHPSPCPGSVRGPPIPPPLLPARGPAGGSWKGTLPSAGKRPSGPLSLPLCAAAQEGAQGCPG